MNRLNLVYYRVEIAGTGMTALAAPRDGFIDNLNTQQYDDEPTTLDLSFAKERANARWEEIVRQTQIVQTPVSLGSIVKGGTPNANTAPTSIAFTIGFDREDYVYTHNTEGTPADTDLLTGEAAIKRMVARALLTGFSANRDIWSPVLKGKNPQGMMYFDIETGPLATSLSSAEAAITVTKVPNV